MAQARLAYWLHASMPQAQPSCDNQCILGHHFQSRLCTCAVMAGELNKVLWQNESIVCNMPPALLEVSFGGLADSLLV